MSDKNFEKKNCIQIKGARVNNLKNIDLEIPRNKFVVITGLSGSGKSSLAFDTLYAEGQRRYVESLSSYARQFLDRISKPEVDLIAGIPPAIAIAQKTNTRNPRSTVGTSSEIYEYLKLLFARVGKTYSPISGRIVKRQIVEDVLNHIESQNNESQIYILTNIIPKQSRTLKEELQILIQTGYSRLYFKNEIVRIEDYIENLKATKTQAKLLIDRIKRSNFQEEMSRVADSVETAFYEGMGSCFVLSKDEMTENITEFNNQFELDGIVFEEPNVNLFSFNNPYGACKTCEGFGSTIGIDDDLVFPDRTKSIFEDAIACWKFDSTKEWKEKLIKNAYQFDFPLHRAIEDLSEQEYALLWNGNEYFYGINSFFENLEINNYKIQNRVFISRFRGKTVCPDCRGSRLRSDAQYVKIANKSIGDIVLMSVKDCLHFFTHLTFEDSYDIEVSERLLTEIKKRLQLINDIGLSYLSINRLSNTLSGGETQRLNIAAAIGSSLVGSMYILDEPSIGLHPRDTQKLIYILKRLRDVGNTVIVVEHDEDIIKAADFIIDIGPDAGRLGGEVVFTGPYEELKKSNTHTALYYTGRKQIPVPSSRRKWKDYIEIIGARENNLKNVNVKVPLNVITVVTGVSGSGKTTLIKKTLFIGLKRLKGGFLEKAGKHTDLKGDINLIKNIEMVDQNPIGRSSRSNPATFIKAFDDIRTLFSEIPSAKTRGYKPGYFSFNVAGGRCDECEGEGIVRIEMQFMSDVELICDSCKGKRYKDDVLDIKYNGISIYDVLEMTINQAIEFFSEDKNNNAKKIVEKLLPLQSVGLGYLKLGQSSSTLSGGEAQRLKLASFLVKGGHAETTLFILDEPTTGLHVHDISRLNYAFELLIEKGHTIVIVEHNQEVIKCADWIIDLGPEGGDEGGKVIFEGTPEDLVKKSNSHTAKYLKEKVIG